MSELKNKKLFLLDMDGTIYLDNQLFPETVPFLEYVKSIGGKCVFLTNNSSKSTDKYIEKLSGMGITTNENDYLTSVDSCAAYLSKKYTNEKIYVFGTKSLRSALSAYGFNVTDKLSDDIKCLVCGFDTELTFQKLEDACILLGRGVDFVATNPDWVCPTWYGFVPDCGSVCEMLFRATGRHPVVTGKPEPDMVNMALEKYGCLAKDTLVVGDRLYTDIACGIAAGVDSAFLLSGEGKLSDIEKMKITPTYIFEDIGKLLEAIKG